ncbi:hypothetical protein AAMO2058_000925900 [Amorphochlora amoebiformis]
MISYESSTLVCGVQSNTSAEEKVSEEEKAGDTEGKGEGLCSVTSRYGRRRALQDGYQDISPYYKTDPSTPYEILNHKMVPKGKYKVSKFIYLQRDIEIKALLGTGQFGDAYVCMIKESKESAVLKVPKSRDSSNEMKRELMGLMNVSGQDNIMRFLGIMYDDSAKECFLTEHCALGSLDKLHHQRDLRDPNIFWKLARGLFLGLAHLQTSKIIHRDIACRNLLMSADWEIKISDFGLAVRAPGDVHQNGMGERLPWPWMAPEALGSGISSHKTDIWAAGVTLWEILTRGSKPYALPSGGLPPLESVVGQITSGSMRLRIPETTKGTKVGHLVQACLRLTPSSRPSALEGLHLWIPGGEPAMKKRGTFAMARESSFLQGLWRKELALLASSESKLPSEIGSRIESKVAEIKLEKLAAKAHKMKTFEFKRGGLTQDRWNNLWVEKKLEAGLHDIPVTLVKMWVEVEQLHLNDNSLESLPQEMACLDQLVTLNLARCGTLKTLPKVIGSLTNLKALDVSQIGLEVLPDEIRLLINLRTLDASSNHLRTVPPEIGALKHLQALHLARNRIKSLPSEIGYLTSLRVLDLSHNSLKALPTDIKAFNNTAELYLNHNKLSHLPDSIIRLVNLRVLDVSHNVLRDLPEGLSCLKSLQHLDLAQNKFAKLPLEIKDLQSLQILNLSSNRLTFIPRMICARLSNLEVLQLAHMRRIVRIPTDISLLTRLHTLDVQNCDLNGFPLEVLHVSGLRVLDLSYNEKISSLPDDLKSLSTLRDLRLNGLSQLTALPKSIEGLASLEKLSLRCCGLSTLPREIGQLNNLREIDLFNNTKLKTLPLEMKKCLFRDKGLSFERCEKLPKQFIEWFPHGQLSHRTIKYVLRSNNVVYEPQ